jgi:hypothetical protein
MLRLGSRSAGSRSLGKELTARLNHKPLPLPLGQDLLQYSCKLSSVSCEIEYPRGWFLQILKDQ